VITETVDEPVLGSPDGIFVRRTQTELFRHNALLRGVSARAYSAIEREIEVVRYRPDEIIFAEDQPGDSVYLIASGSVRVSKKGRGGHQETLADLLQGDFFGEMALLDGSKRSAQASAAVETVLGRIDRRGWNVLLKIAPHELLSNFTQAVTQRLRHNNQHFIEQMMLNERLSLLGSTISSIVHDMNNPISCILTACTVIGSRVQDEVTTEMAALIRDSVKQMDMMARERIDFSRGKTRLQIKPVAMADLVADLKPHFEKCQPFIEVKTKINYIGTLQADRYRLLRVFGNLIRNAREAMGTKQGSQLSFSVEQVGSSVQFVIADNGPGIPNELLPQIFEPFVTHGKAEGTGLGLAISKAVVEAHHGTISVSSSDQGTAFQIDLPVQPPLIA
jgi:signal transduction histidine kinase